MPGPTPENKARVIIIDDEDGIRFSLRGILEDEGYEVLEAGTAEDGLATLATEPVNLMFLDIWLPGMDGLAALERIQQTNPSLPVIMISGHGTIETAVAAIKKGAYDYIEKPLSLEKVVLSSQRALEFQALKRENQALRSRSPFQVEFSGTSPEAVILREQIAKVAPLDTWVLITGENGTGKEITARSLHAKSRRNDKPLVAVNCAAIPEELIESELFGHEKGAFTGADAAKTGKFELAHEGTLFLDEIGDMSLKTQAKILRILQEQRFERVGGNRTIHVNVRVIAATNKNLEEAIAEGAFREDLYYRLRVFPIAVPPLRERGDDVVLLLNEFIENLGREHGLAPFVPTPEALDRIRSYPWPGNVRELRNFAERSLILYGGQTMTTAMLPPEFRSKQENGTPRNSVGAGKGGDFFTRGDFGDSDFKTARTLFENRFLTAKFQEYGGNITRLAEGIGLERSYLHRKLKALGINAPQE